MPNIEIVNKRGIPQVLLYLKDKFNEPFWIRFVTPGLIKTASYTDTHKLIKNHILTDRRSCNWLSFEIDFPSYARHAAVYKVKCFPRQQILFEFINKLSEKRVEWTGICKILFR